ncbi:type II secretion system protein [bacterium]|nr:type II secretion system protein [bacterium]
MTNKLTQFTTHSSQFTNFAFTLAETLIVMGIIGVVAALTLPNLNSSTGDKEKVVKVKKIYQNLNDAMGRATAVYGPYDEWFVNDANAAAQRTRFAQRLTEFMKVTKSSNTSTANLYTLSDGTTLNITSKGFVKFDIDGDNKGKNQEIYDIFALNCNNEGCIAEISDMDNYKHWCLSSYKIVQSCTGWIIQYDNMDYLKADSNGKCNNSNVTLNDTITSCK